MADDIRARFTVDGLREAASGLRDVGSAAGDVGDDLDDGRTKAQRFADELAAFADNAETQLTAARAAADALGAALGPELAAKLGQSGIDQLVADANRAGVTFDDLEANAEQVAAAVKRLDDIDLKSVSGEAQHLAGAVDKVRANADQSRSVMANFAGNAAQELPGVAGAFGPLNMAVSQFVEYGAEGGIKLGNLAKMAGPMLGVSVAVAAVAGHMKKVAEAKAFHRDRVDAYYDAIRDGLPLLDSVRKKLEETGKVEVEGFFGKMNIAGQLAALGLSIGDFQTLVGQSTEQTRAWAEELAGAGADGEALAVVLSAVSHEHENLSKAQELAARTAALLGDNNRTGADYAALAASKTKALADATDETAAAQDRQAKAADAAARRTADLEGAWNSLTGALADESAFLDVQDQFDAVQTSAEEAWTAAAEGADDAEQKARANKEEIIRLKEQVVTYGREVLGLPPERVTSILAQIDSGSIADAEATLALLERNRQVNLFIVQHGGAGYDRYGPQGQHANAGMIRAGEWGTVGEAGRETVESPTMVRGPAIVRRWPNMAPAPAPSVTNVYMTMPAGIDPAAVVQAQREYARRNGGAA